jgi:predicted nucleotidyltransferase component of viral defense system
MLTRSQLRRLHGGDLPLHVLEQDYVQALFLKELYLATENLVFKGGTYLRHAYGLDRYSGDLDFTRYGMVNSVQALKDAALELSSYGLEASITRINEGDFSINGFLRYRGPLYDGTEISIGAIDIEVSTREDIFLDPVWTRLFSEYPETRVVNVLGLRKEEAFAEKLRALSTRTKGRDLYDVWFLLRQGVEVQKSLFESKMGVLKEKPVVRIRVSKREWERDLDVLLVNPPEYEEVLNEVVDRLRNEVIEVSVE